MTWSILALDRVASTLGAAASAWFFAVGVLAVHVEGQGAGCLSCGDGQRLLGVDRAVIDASVIRRWRGWTAAFGRDHHRVMSIVLYDLAGADPDLRFSPYCWRTRFALAHKGLPVETVPWRFTDREAIAFSSQGKVPVINHDGKIVSDSWTIAEYLEDQVPAPTLFGGATGRAHAAFVNAWADAVLVGGIAGFIVRDLLDVIDPKDRDYFRSSREARFGCSLEAVQDGREDRLSAFRDLLLPIRLVLRRQQWLGGAAPSYADHIIAGTLMWPRCASRFELLEDNDPVAVWMGRVLDLYGGLGRSAKRA